MDLKTLAIAKKYTDSQRIGWKEQAIRSSAEEITIDIQMIEDFGFHMALIEPLDIEVGDMVTVTWDGVKYTTPYQRYEYGDGYSEFIGNPYFIGIDRDNGLPFCYTATYLSESNLVGCLLGDIGKHRFAYSATMTVTHQIPSEYIPPYFNVVSLETTLYMYDEPVDDIVMTESDGIALNQCLKLGNPFFIEYRLQNSTAARYRILANAGGTHIVAIMTHLINGDIPLTRSIVFKKYSDGLWHAKQARVN